MDGKHFERRNQEATPAVPKKMPLSVDCIRPGLKRFVSLAVNGRLPAFLSYSIHKNVCYLIIPKAEEEILITGPGNKAFFWE